MNFLHDNEAMNVASENWEELFKELEKEPEISEEGWREDGYGDVELPDSKADWYDFANEVLMRRMRERLVETLQRREFVLDRLMFGNKFFMTMDEQQQQTFFHCIFNLQVDRIQVGEPTDNSTERPAITIHTSALLETLPQLHPSVLSLALNNFALTRQSDVQRLSNVIGSKRERENYRENYLGYLALESIECPVDHDCNKQDSDGPIGFLDPLFHVDLHFSDFLVSTKMRSVHSTLVSPRALRALFVERKGICRRELRLNGLGLTDNHALAIVDGLSIPGSHCDYLKLESNPGITSQGYGALLNLINRANVVGYALFDEWYGFCVDDKAWEGELNLVSEMNSEFSRLEYLTNGTFTSEERRWQWLESVVSLPGCYEDEWGDEDDEDRRIIMEFDAKHLNFIWYTLRQNPQMMQT